MGQRKAGIKWMIPEMGEGSQFRAYQVEIAGRFGVMQALLIGQIRARTEWQREDRIGAKKRAHPEWIVLGYKGWAHYMGPPWTVPKVRRSFDKLIRLGIIEKQPPLAHGLPFAIRLNVDRIVELVFAPMIH